MRIALFALYGILLNIAGHKPDSGAFWMLLICTAVISVLPDWEKKK